MKPGLPRAAVMLGWGGPPLGVATPIFGVQPPRAPHLPFLGAARSSVHPASGTAAFCSCLLEGEQVTSPSLLVFFFFCLFQANLCPPGGPGGPGAQGKVMVASGASSSAGSSAGACCSEKAGGWRLPWWPYSNLMRSSPMRE